MTDSRTDTASAPEPFANPARTDTELISPSRVPAEQGAGSREQEKNLSDSTIHPTTSTSTRTPDTVDGTTRPCATLTAQHATAMLDQLEADREQSRYWQDRWATDHGDHHIDAWLTSLADWLPEERAETPTDQRPVAPLVARDLGSDYDAYRAAFNSDVAADAWVTKVGQAAVAVCESVPSLRDENGRLRTHIAEIQENAAYVWDLVLAGRTELERTEGDLAVAVREANHHRGLVAKVAGLHVDDGEGFCGACRTEAWPCATAKAVSVPVPS